MRGVELKTAEDIATMTKGGEKLSQVRLELERMVDVGVSAWDIEEEACRLIEKLGGKISFKMVPGYSWATCININEGVVHGIPKKDMVFKNGDIVSIDVGLFYHGFHTDTSTSVLIGADKDKKKFLAAGKQALNNAILEAKPGNRIYDISFAIQQNIEEAGYNVIQALTGHGVGRQLHEDPYIPCFVFKGAAAYKKTPEIKAGMVLAIEVMYTLGSPELETLEDSWTIVTQDGKISALFEETVAVLETGPVVLTGVHK